MRLVPVGMACFYPRRREMQFRRTDCAFVDAIVGCVERSSNVSGAALTMWASESRDKRTT